MSTDAAKMAATAWDRYVSTVRLGGTPEQRAWAFHHALEAEERANEKNAKARTLEIPAVKKAA